MTDIYEIRSGLSKPAAAFGSGYPFLTFKEVFNNFFLPDNLTQLVQSTDSERALGEIRRGDVFLTRTSETLNELGMSSVALKDYPNSTFNGFTKRLRPRADSPFTVHPEFIGYCLRSQSFRRGVLALTSLSTRASLNNEMIGRLQVVLPPPEIQKSIAKTLKCLDDKIVVNRRINQTLEAMAQAIFTSWFVDFDPVKAKIAAIAEGRDPLRAAMSSISGKPDAELDALPPEHYEQLATTAAIFPEGMEESEWGEIPQGWACGALGDVCSFTAGSAFKPEHQGSSDGDYPFIKVSDMNLAGNEVFIQSANNYVSKGQQSEMKAKLHPPGATVFAKIGVALTSNRRRLLTTPTIIDNNLMSANPVDENSGRYFLYSMLNMIDFNTLVSGTALPYINVSDLKKIPIVRPMHEVVLAFETKVSSTFTMMQTLAAQSSTLAKTRNILLPKLISGEVEVSGIQGS